MNYTFWGYSTKGIRSNNEDSFLADGNVCGHDTEAVEVSNFQQEPQPKSEVSPWRVFAVADGMGGHAAGEIASRMALGRLSEAVASQGDVDEGKLIQVIRDLHTHILEQGRSLGQSGMGCTLTGLLFKPQALWVFNVGDSRTYRLLKGFLNQVTRDHNLKSLLSMNGGAQNQLYSCLGGGAEECTVDVWDLSEKIRNEEIFLLASDGYHEFISEDFWENGLLTPWDIDAFRAEVQNAVKRGSQDNATVLVLRIESKSGHE